MFKLKYLPLLVLFFITTAAKTQTDFNTGTWFYIDSSIAKKNNLTDLLATVKSLKQKAIAAQQYWHVARCLNYEIQIADIKTEDSLYFKNSSFIDEMLIQQQPPSLQYALHMMQATRLLNFNRHYKRFQRARYERSDILINYASNSNAMLDSFAQLHFEQAKLIAQKNTLKNIDNALWLSADPLQFLYQPDFFDLAIAEQINAVKKTYFNNLQWSTKLAGWLKLNADEFITKIDSLKEQPDKLSKDLLFYTEWLHYQKNKPGNYYFVETVLRKYIYELIKPQQVQVEKTYENYLLQNTQSLYNTVKAYSVYQLCLLWNNQGNKYFPDKTSVYDFATLSYKVKNDFDSAFRYHPVKALQLFNDNKKLLDSFAYLKNILNSMKVKITAKDQQLSVPENNLPSTPFLAELKFKNTDTLFYTIVKIAAGYSFAYANPQRLIDNLLEQTIVKQTYVALARTYDCNYHNVYINMDAMPVGHYAIVFSAKPIKEDSITRRYVYFNVTNIALVNNDKRIYILDRKNGKPLEGAIVSALYKETIKKEGNTNVVENEKRYVVNKKGFIEISNNHYTDLTVNIATDTLIEKVEYSKYEMPEDIYTKDDYDDLMEFYEENASVRIFTDRSIYRPGQTVFYKALFITKNRITGEPMVMSKQNLNGKLWGNIYKKLLKEEKPMLFITDPFYKNMDSAKVALNEFGTMSGSYKIPLTAAIGEWEIGPDYMDLENNSGTFKVEEYKKPSYEIELIKPKQELKLGDSFLVKVKVRSFAGAVLNNVKIKYDVYRTAGFVIFDTATNGNLNQNGNKILIDTIDFTNDKGELEIWIKDRELLHKTLSPKDNWNIGYDITAEAIDATGESYEKSTNVYIAAKPINIKINLDGSYNRNDMKEVLVTTSDKNAGAVNKTVYIKIYRRIKNISLYNDRNLTKADVWLYDKIVLQQTFPYDNLSMETSAEQRELVYEKVINTTNSEKLLLQPELFTAGNYILEANSKEEDKITGEITKYFLVFDNKENKLPESTWSFKHLPVNSANAGDTITYSYGNSYGDAYTIFHVAYLSGKNKSETKYFYDEQIAAKGVQQYNFKIPDGAVDQLKITQLYILNNQIFSNSQTIYINAIASAEPEIIIEKYRKILTPGSKETFSVSIKSNNENTAAELMTTMYDASLDKLEEHNWKNFNSRIRRGYINLNWTRSINSIRNNNNELYYYSNINMDDEPTERVQPLWWLNPLDYAYDEITVGARNKPVTGTYNFQHDLNPDIRYNDPYELPTQLSGKAPGLSLASTQGLNEVVVTGYGTAKNQALAGSVSGIRLRGISSLSAYSQPLIVLDGVVYDKELNTLDAKNITAAIVLKGADAVAIYGTRASGGVLILSTKGEIILPVAPVPEIIPRKNFNETAFFFPAIHVGRDGYYTFSFTMPESVTEWRWKLLAHTKKAVFAYAERTLNSQLSLMVQPNMPRLLYQGDKIILQSRLTNLDTASAEGKIYCKIEDVVTGNDITPQCVPVAQNNFTIAAKSNTASAFTITIPKEQLHPVKIRITARSQNFSDGEEYTLPILNTNVFVRENIPFYILPQKDTTITLTTLPANTDLFGMGISVQPKPQAALLNSLPALANYAYGCAEQTFNKLLAFTTAYKLIRTDTATQKSFDGAKNFVENETAAIKKLPDELAKETMPWLNLENKRITEQQQLFNLLDTSQSKEMIVTLVNRLQKLQNTDGGISWFDGGKSSVYISNYVLRGLAKSAADNQLLPKYIFTTNEYQHFFNELVKYCDADFAQHNTDIELYSGLYYAYCRSYALSTHPLADSLQQTVKKLLATEWKKKNNQSLNQRALLIIATFKYAGNTADSLYVHAVAALQQLQQMAIADEQNGIRWKELADNDDLTNTAEETIALLAEAFALHQKNNPINKGIIKWLLTAKNEHSWSSTKATAAAINLLTNENNTAGGVTQEVKMILDKTKVTVSNDLLKGNIFNYTAYTDNKATVQIQNMANTAAIGNLYRYYFTAIDNVLGLNKDVHIIKQCFKWNNNSNQWEVLLPDSNIKIADKIKISLTIESSKALQYVFLNDSRAATFEPLDNNSGYQYSDGMQYYQSIRDAGHQFFIDFIPSGKHTVSYEVKVAQEGAFTNGIATLQCMYRPDITAYSNTVKINCEK